MMWIDDKGRLRCLLILIFIDVCCLSAVSGFSDGSKLAKGSATTRSLYCNRQANRRAPLHFDPSCSGYCEPRSDFQQFYTLTVSNATYWLDVVRVNISAKPASGKSVTGFSLYAIDESGHVAGSFVEDDTNVVVGTCNDLIAVTDETHAAFHKMADHGRKNVSIQWQPDGYNHGRVRFVLWVVNNHSDIYFVESQWLTSQKDGSDTLDVRITLDKIASAIDIDIFENNFKYRSTKGYNLALTNPFSAFDRSPSKNELVPANFTGSSGGSNLTSANSSLVLSQPGANGTNASSTLEVAAINATSGVPDGSVLGNRDMNATKVNNVNDTIMFNISKNLKNTVNDTRLYNLTETNMDSLNDTNQYTMNQTTMGNVNDTNQYTTSQPTMGNVNDTNQYTMNQTTMGNVNDTNQYTMNQPTMGNVNDTNQYTMNQTTMGNVNDTNQITTNQPTMGNVNDTNQYTMNQTTMGNVNDTYQYTTNQPTMGNVNDTNQYTTNQPTMGNVNDTNQYTTNQPTMGNVNDTNHYATNQPTMGNVNDTNQYTTNQPTMGNVNDTNHYTTNQPTMGNVNDTNQYTTNQPTMGNVNDTNQYTTNQPTMGNVNDTKQYTTNQPTMGNVNDTKQYTTNQPTMGNVNDTNQYTMNQTTMGNVNDTNQYTMNQTDTGNVNDTNQNTMKKINMNNINDTIAKNLTFNPASSGSQTTQLDNTINQNIPDPSQIPVVGTSGSQLTDLDNNAQVNTAVTPINTTPYPQLSDSQTTALSDNNVHTTTNNLPDLKRSGSQVAAAPDNQRIFKTAGTTPDTTPSPGPSVSERTATIGDDGFSTSAYLDVPATNRVDISTMSLPTSESPSSNPADAVRPAAV